MAVYSGEQRAAGLAKESALGTLATPPTEFLPFISPDSFFPSIDLMESPAIGSLSDLTISAWQGAALLRGMRIKWWARPENIGNLLMAAFGQDIVSGSAAAGYTHAFRRLASELLPTYSWWFDRGAKYPQFLGCMLNSLDILIKKDQVVLMESDWSGIGYDGDGTSKTPTYNATAPFKFDHVQVNLDGSAVTYVDDVRITLRNNIATQQQVGSSIYPAKIYSEGFDCTISFDAFVEDAVQYNKFLAGSQADLNLVLTSGEDISGATPGTKHRLELDMPTVMYQVAAYPNQTPLMKYAFVGRALYNSSDGYSVAANLKNSVAAAY